MWEHSYDKYRETYPQFVMNATETFHGDLMLRQVTEWVLINEVEESANQIQKWMEILPHPENYSALLPPIPHVSTVCKSYARV